MQPFIFERNFDLPTASRSGPAGGHCRQDRLKGKGKGEVALRIV
jgi:hypothetical protein